MDDKVRKMMSSVFGIDISEINDDSSPDTIEVWDSLKHMNLVVVLEEEFNVEFSDEEIGDMLNVKLIVAILKEKQHL